MTILLFVWTKQACCLALGSVKRDKSCAVVVVVVVIVAVGLLEQVAKLLVWFEFHWQREKLAKQSSPTDIDQLLSSRAHGRQ